MRPFLLFVVSFCGLSTAASTMWRTRAALWADETGTSEATSEADVLKSLLEKRDGDAFWLCVQRLESLGPAAASALREGLAAGSEKVRLGCAKALLQVGDISGRNAAIETLAQLSKKAAALEVKTHAAEIYGLNADPDQALGVLGELLEGSSDPRLVITLARTLWEIDHVAAARDRLVGLVASQDPAVRNEAALTLAEIGYFEGQVQDVLRSLAKEPTERGRRALALQRVVKLTRQLEHGLKKGSVTIEGVDPQKLVEVKEKRIRELEERLGRAEGSPAPPAASSKPEPARSPADRVLEEVLEKIQAHYVDSAQVDRDRLVREAIKGMVAALDDFSVFMEPEASKEFTQAIKGEYPGIGAQVSKPDAGALEVVRPIYGGPAHRAGLRSGDRLVAIGGVETRDQKLEELVDLLKGPSGTPIQLKVLRRGWNEPRDFAVLRETIELPSVFYESLPGGIGVLALTQFGDRSADEFIDALRKLEGAELHGLILDLRNNGGGRLDIAVRIADLFVKGELPIVTQKGRPEDRDNEKSTYPEDDARTGYPMVVLVNGGSASASEIVAGALQDFGRAKLVGQRTFGKGSVQNVIPLSTSPGSRLKLTVQYWYLPLDRCIQTVRDEKGRVVKQGGVEPDVVVEPLKMPAWRLEERALLRRRSEVLDYVDVHFESLKSLVPCGSGGDVSKYPRLAELMSALRTHAAEADVCDAIRHHVRQRLEDARGRSFACDLEEDVQLQHAVLEVLKQLGKEAKAFAEYAWLATRG
jgi:carboxyl-terminal processing protease